MFEFFNSVDSYVQTQKGCPDTKPFKRIDDKITTRRGVCLGTPIKMFYDTTMPCCSCLFRIEFYVNTKALSYYGHFLPQMTSPIVFFLSMIGQLRLSIITLIVYLHLNSIIMD